MPCSTKNTSLKILNKQWNKHYEEKKTSLKILNKQWNERGLS